MAGSNNTNNINLWCVSRFISFITGLPLKILNAKELARRLTIEPSEFFTVIRFRTPANGVASPVFRSNTGFVQGGLTRGGAREYVIPNGPLPVGSSIWYIGP